MSFARIYYYIRNNFGKRNIFVYTYFKLLHYNNQERTENKNLF